MNALAIVVLAATATTANVCPAPTPVDPAVLEFSDAKLAELSELPIGLVVTHSPDRATARQVDGWAYRYQWPYATTVRPIDGPVTIVEFGCFSWREGRWVFNAYQGKPFTGEQFAEWYDCAGATIAAEAAATDPANWSGSDCVQSMFGLWYYIGEDAQGRRVKGTAVVEALPRVVTADAAAATP